MGNYVMNCLIDDPWAGHRAGLSARECGYLVG